ncbi:MAG: type II toxin-antitoxin system YhaV family toxin [Sulfuricella sp.]|nr:type II toxin-antitoxin system YhaV family toxin [Sulfuricella sp.]
MQRHGWSLLFHDCLVEQLQKLKDASDRAETADPSGFEANANVKLFRALSQLIFETVPSDPAREEYRQGNTMGTNYRHWRRAKIGRRFRLFFRYDSKAKVIVFAWVNDEHTLRSAGSQSDPYAVFRKMLDRGNPPDDWAALLAASRADLNQDSQLSR